MPSKTRSSSRLRSSAAKKYKNELGENKLENK